VLATSDYGGEFVAAVQRGNVCATQVRPPACLPLWLRFASYWMCDTSARWQVQ